MADLRILYDKVVAITSKCCASGFKECAPYQNNKYRCCERRYCELAREFAKEKYNIELKDTGNPDLPFMGESGCVVEPYLRPVCSIHTCSWSWATKQQELVSKEDTEAYNALREVILKEAAAQNKFPIF